MTQDKAREIIERAVSCSTADHTEVSVGWRQEKASRFANNAMVQSVSTLDRGVSVRVAFGQKVGAAATNKVDDDALRETVARAEAIAKSAEPDTEYVPPPGPQEYAPVKAYHSTTADRSHEDRAKAIQAALGPVVAAKHRSAGSYTTWVSRSAVGNSSGLFGYHEATDASYGQTVLTEDSSGWAESASVDASRVDTGLAGRVALEKAEAARNPGEIEPGAYTVVMEPAAFAGLLGIANWTMQAKAAHEGRSCWTGKEGTKIGVDALNIASVPGHPDVPGQPWTQQGLAAKEVKWVENGVLNTLMYDRYWAEKCGREATGHPANTVVSGGDASLEDLVASVDRGVLITRFWYIRFVDPMQLLITGMTRDGLFLIEGGKIVRGLRNMRFNDSPLRVFQEIRALGVPRRTALQGYMVVPPVLVEGFHFTSQTSF